MAKRASKKSPSGSSHRFVLVAEAGFDPSQLEFLAEDGLSLELVNGRAEMVIATVAPSAATSTAEAAWEWLIARVGPTVSVLPIEEDSSGGYPTGQIGVRFDKSHTVSDLKKLAKRLDLEFLGKNEYVPEQATFRIAKRKSVWMPGVMKALESPELGVQKAWPESIRQFKRGSDSDDRGA